MRSAVRRKAPRGQQYIEGTSLPAPTGGWDAVSPIANMPKDRALVLDNWFPTPTDVRVRRGSVTFANGMGTGPVETVLVYRAQRTVNDKMFSATGNKIYDVSAGGVGVESLTTLSSNQWQSVNFTTSGGHFLWACNGVDAPVHYNGSVWANPALSITTFTADQIVNVNAHKQRLWFIFKDSTVAAFLPVQSIAGTVSNFDIGPMLTKGGYLVAMATWTHDGGNGPDDYAVFISSEGQVVIYKGTDPTDASTWFMVGVFDLGPPLGYRCFTKVAADLALINVDGVLPLSKALGVDRGASATVAITKNINNAMNEAARLYKGNFGWQLLPYPKGTYVLLNVPIQQGNTQHQYVMNTLTGAWCRFTGQNANCWALYKDDLYFGGNDGTVSKADTGSIDGNHQIDAIGQSAYSFYGSPGQFKQWKLIRAIMTTDASIVPAIAISTDFKDNADLGSPSIVTGQGATYDNAVFDSATFAAEDSVSADWISAPGEGYCASIHFRAMTGRPIGVWGDPAWGEANWAVASNADVTMRLNNFSVIYERGLVL